MAGRRTVHPSSQAAGQVGRQIGEMQALAHRAVGAIQAIGAIVQRTSGIADAIWTGVRSVRARIR